MLEFREIQISDKERITAALRASDFRGCEYSFANNGEDWLTLKLLSLRIFTSPVHLIRVT